MANTELMVDVLAQVELEPERYTQNTWARAPQNGRPKASSCNTSFCIAGWTTALSGVKLEWTQTLDGNWTSDTTDDNESVSSRAQELLDLNSDDARALFDGSNTLGNVYEHAAEACELDEEELRDRVQAKVEVLREARKTELAWLKIKLAFRPPAKQGKRERLRKRVEHLQDLVDRWEHTR